MVPATKQQRQSNLELCRILAIVLVVLVHSNFGWCGWPANFAEAKVPMLFVEAFAIVGVNVFVLLTGYFSIKIKTSSVVNLLYICLFYAIVRLFADFALESVNYKNLLFVSNSNWFIPSYIGLLLLSPFLNSLKPESPFFGKILLALILFEIWFGYFPAKAALEPGFQHGYSVLSFAVLYLTARYVREKGFPKFFRKYSVVIYIASSIAIALEAYFLLYAYKNSDLNMGEKLNFFVYAYNNPLVLIASLAFFASFEKIKMECSKVINYIAQSVLAVLLIHGSSSLNFKMKSFFPQILQDYDGAWVVLFWILGIVLIFAVCVVVDQVRIVSYKFIGPLLVKRIESLTKKENG